jgi:hypothetical protein
MKSLRWLARVETFDTQDEVRELSAEPVDGTRAASAGLGATV